MTCHGLDSSIVLAAQTAWRILARAFIPASIPGILLMLCPRRKQAIVSSLISCTALGNQLTHCPLSEA